MRLITGRRLIASGLGRTTSALSLGHADSLVVVHRLSTCSEVASCPMVCGIFILRLGTELMSPVLQGGFLTTGPRGSPYWTLKKK